MAEIWVSSTCGGVSQGTRDGLGGQASIGSSSWFRVTLETPDGFLPIMVAVISLEEFGSGVGGDSQRNHCFSLMFFCLILEMLQYTQHRSHRIMLSVSHLLDLGRYFSQLLSN